MRGWGPPRLAEAALVASWGDFDAHVLVGGAGVGELVAGDGVGADEGGGDVGAVAELLEGEVEVGGAGLAVVLGAL